MNFFDNPDHTSSYYIRNLYDQDCQKISMLNVNAAELYSGIANGRVLIVEFYTDRNQKLLFLQLFCN